MSRRGQPDNSCQVLCVQEGKARKEMRAEKRKKREGRKKRRISKMGSEGLRREKSRRNSSTFTLVPPCVVGKM